VHVLSEHVFCPRAAVLALESGEDEGDEEPMLGPRLDLFVDYNEHRFAEGLHTAWGELRLWFALLAPAILLVLIVWYLASPVWGAAVALPAIWIASKIWELTMRIAALVREQGSLRAAAVAPIDLAPEETYKINWWTLRKAGFDCLKLHDAYPGLAEGVTGKPWRVLMKDTVIRIPVIRKHRGAATWGPQHVVRAAAYCRLITKCEGGNAPFGILMFAGSYDCLVIPNNEKARSQFEQALKDVREFLDIYEGGKFVPAAPRDNRCSGCHYGKPRKYTAGKSDTVLGGRVLAAWRTNASNGRSYHCTCGDRFTDTVPPHKDAVALGIAEEDENA
jgi:hypothetical protein